MFGYNLRLSWLSIRKAPVLSLLMVTAIAMGIGVCMTILTVYTLSARDPIPGKSDVLYTYALDNHLRARKGQELDDPRPYVGYRDVMNLRKSTIPAMQSIHYQSSVIYEPEAKDLKPFRDTLRLATNGFFTMFDVPFKYGQAWSDADAQNQAFVMVLTEPLNDRLFGGANSVGKTVRFGDHRFKVVGVLDHFSPMPRYFEMDGGSFRKTTGAFVPFSLTPVLKLGKANGSVSCQDDADGDGFQAFLDAECTWIHHWVMLKTPADRQAYLDMLNRYAMDQRQFGRFQGPFRNRLFNVMQWLKFQKVVNPTYKVLIGIAFMFLLVCLLNTTGLLLARFTGRSTEMSLRRALGCSRRQMFMRHLVEVGVIGAAGGLLGLAFAELGLIGLRKMFPWYGAWVHMDLALVLLALGIAILATIVAGVLPVWRICQLPPANYLKAQ